MRAAKPGRRALPAFRRASCGAPVRAGLTRQRAAQHTEPALRGAQVTWVGYECAGGQYGEVLDPDVDTDNRAGASRAAFGAFDLDGERDVPPCAVTPDGRGHDPGRPVVQAAGEFAGG